MSPEQESRISIMRFLKMIAPGFVGLVESSIDEIGLTDEHRRKAILKAEGDLLGSEEICAVLGVDNMREVSVDNAERIVGRVTKWSLEIGGDND